MRISLIILLLLQSVSAAAQEPTGLPHGYEQQLESQAEREEGITEDDTQWQHLHYLQKHPLNLNTADEEELTSLSILSDLQISNFLRYRLLLGTLLSIYELQAIPTWDLATIQRLLPFVTVRDDKSPIENMVQRLKHGEQKLLLRISGVPERAKGYIKTGDSSTYLGSRSAMLMRYTYKYKNLLQYGITGDKDAGEEFFKGSQRKGFDFCSFHFFVRNAGMIQLLAIGDHTIHLGQGLIQWQGLAFKKSATVLNVKRQAPVLQPYSSAGEFNFYRGVGITLQQKKMTLSLFGSLRKLSANVGIDSAGEYISSVITSGYNRSITELANKNNTQCMTAGGSLQFRNNRLQVGLNTIHHRFSKPFQAASEPYDLFALNGDTWHNYSIDYGYTVRNVHVFGEIAVDKYLHTAQVHGMLASLDPKIDMALLYRAISPQYLSLFSNAFTESTAPVNEKGMYAGITVRPAYGVQLDAYADFFRFPWLKFQTNASATGQEYLVQCSFTPNKLVEIYTRYRHETKPMKAADTGMVIRPLTEASRTNWRTQITYRYSRQWLLRSRVEVVWYKEHIQQATETGYLFFQDIQYKPAYRAWSLNGRLLYMETGGYNSRIYAMENQLLYNYSIPAFFDKGWRYGLTIHYRLTSRRPERPLACLLALAAAQTFYPAKTTVGSGYDAVEGQKRSEIKLQVIVSLR